MRLTERMPIVCKAVLKAKGGYFAESETKLSVLDTWWIYGLTCEDGLPTGADLQGSKGGSTPILL